MKKLILFILFILTCSIGFSQTIKNNKYTIWGGVVVTKKQFRDSLNKLYLTFCDSLKKSQPIKVF
jgi:hypothetical protein